jgi:hypothetical protein
LQHWEYFRDVGIKFIFEGNRFDMVWVGQASYSIKSKDVFGSTKHGVNKLKRLCPVGTDYVLFDGQDSASLIGTYDVFSQVEHRPLKFFKNSLYKDLSHYTRKSPHGRIYWDRDANIDWSVDNPKYLENVELSSTNWLSTVTPNWFKYKGATKDIDVFAMFACGTKENFEFNNRTDFYYDHHRQRCLNWLNMLPNDIKVAKLTDGVKVPIEEYYSLMSRSKIVIAPFGYGEMAPRDIEAASVAGNPSDTGPCAKRRSDFLAKAQTCQKYRRYRIIAPPRREITVTDHVSARSVCISP